MMATAHQQPDLLADAQRHTWNSPAGGLTLYHANEAKTPSGTSSQEQQKFAPLLLLHSINAVGSSAEMAPLFARYRKTRAVYALDLPGFGHSERSDRPYSPRLMTDAVLCALKYISGRHADCAVDVAALSLSGEFAARAAVEQPALVQRLVLISPTGFNGRPRRYGAPQSTLGQAWLHGLLSHPRWSKGLYRNLTRPGVIRYFLQRSWGGKSIDETLWALDVELARQPGAHHAPLYFLSAHLFSADINTVYESLRCPVWVSMATRGDFTDYRGRSSLDAHPNWQFHAITGGALPYFETGNDFMQRLDAFLSGALPG